MERVGRWEDEVVEIRRAEEEACTYYLVEVVDTGDFVMYVDNVKMIYDTG